jgi:hypothetical protein
MASHSTFKCICVDIIGNNPEIHCEKPAKTCDTYSKLLFTSSWFRYEDAANVILSNRSRNSNKLKSLKVH